MLKNIKSIYISEIIFSYIGEKKMLNLIKNNKLLQQKYGITLSNYELFSGKYFREEKNGIMKIYNSWNDKLIFEGEFSKGEKRKGKEYNENGKLIYEGEYLKGEKNGKGKEYIDGNLIFEGEYLNGKKWNGKGYYLNHNISYELKEGKGYVKEYDGDKLIFEGEYLNGEKNGIGREYNLKGQLIFEGEYLNGLKWNGKGYDINKNIAYELNNGKGYVKLYYDYGVLKFEGEYLYGNRYGKGKEYNYDGQLIFEGEYQNGKKWNGKIFDSDNKIINELKNGKGNIKEYGNEGQI